MIQLPRVLILLLLSLQDVTFANIPAGGQVLIANEIGSTPVTDSITYSCTFTDNWTPENHPALFPGSAAHWSPPLLAAHGTDYSLWSIGDLASSGVEAVAEQGATSILVSELVDERIAEPFRSVLGSSIFGSGAQRVLPDIMLNSKHPLLSGISMIAPSPDWFAGIRDVMPITGGLWWKSFDINMFPIDAGTEMGETYSLSNPAESPPLGIMEIDVNTVPSTKVFLNAAENYVIYVAKLSCLEQPSDETDPEEEDEEENFLSALLSALVFCLA